MNPTFKKVAGVRIVRNHKSIEFHIPSTMTGATLMQWKSDNAAAIEVATAELLATADSVEGDRLTQS